VVFPELLVVLMGPEPMANPHGHFPPARAGGLLLDELAEACRVVACEFPCRCSCVFLSGATILEKSLDEGCLWGYNLVCYIAHLIREPTDAPFGNHPEET